MRLDHRSLTHHSRRSSTSNQNLRRTFYPQHIFRRPSPIFTDERSTTYNAQPPPSQISVHPPNLATSHALAVTPVAVKASLSLRSSISLSKAPHPSCCVLRPMLETVFSLNRFEANCQSDTARTISSLTVFSSQIGHTASDFPVVFSSSCSRTLTSSVSSRYRPGI